MSTESRITEATLIALWHYGGRDTVVFHTSKVIDKIDEFEKVEEADRKLTAM